MTCREQGRSLLAGATFSRKPVNQDAFQCIQNDAAGLNAVVVADGLGSHHGAEIASSIAVKTVAEILKAVAPGDEINMVELFAIAWRKIVQYACENLPESIDLGSQDAFGTTLLCAVETSTQIILAYVGNGAIFHIRANFNTFPAQRLLPWTALNYLNPHSLSQGGKPGIYRLLSLKASPNQIVPTVLALSKDQQSCGDIILCCTDGICSYDQTAIGYDDRRQIWMHADPGLPLFFARLAAFFQGPNHAEALTSSLETFLRDLDAGQGVEDDCTAAVLITAEALQYQAARRNLKAENTVV